MTDKIEIQGKTVDAAVSEALLQMGARRDEVEIKVLEEPKGGFLGLLGGRPARVLVRKKRGRRQGGRNQDHRQDQDGYGFSGDGQSRRSGGRRGGGGRGSSQASGRNEKQDDNRRGGGRGRSQRTEGQGGRQDQQDTRKDARAEGQGQNDRQADGERKSGGTRRGSRGGRGRGGRGRRQGAVAQDQSQSQSQNDSRGNERRDAAPRNDQGGRPERSDQGDQRNERSRRGGRGRGDLGRGDQGDARQADGRRDENRRPDSSRDSGPQKDNRREQQRQERSRRDSRPASAEVAPSDTPATAPAPAAAVKSVNELHPIRRAAEVKKADPEAPAPTKPGKKRAFGGLGARRKSSLEAAAQKAKVRETEARQVAETRAEDTSATDEAAARARAKPGEIRRKGAPEGDGGGARESRAPRRDSARREAGYPSREPGDEVIIAEVKAVSYAKPVDAPADEAALDTLKELASGMLARAGFTCDVETRPDEYSQVIVSTDEENAGMLIGRHGQAVEAVEHLVERMASNAANDRVRMNLDINEYRVRRQESLLERVRGVVADVRETGKAYHMEPMDARERRLVHMGAADEEGIKTYTQIGSRGKHVVIAADDGGEADQNDEPVFTDEG